MYQDFPGEAILECGAQHRFGCFPEKKQPNQLIEALHAWVLVKHRTLGDLLRERGALGAAEQTALEALLQWHLAKHGGAADQSLRALSSVSSSARQALAAVADGDVQASMRWGW